MNQQHHEMVLEMTHASGMQGWYCPTCGRRILLYVPPKNSMIIVETGDPYANHTGSMGGLRVGGVQIKEEDGDVPEKSLRPWIKALENLNLDW
jgi:hypothetical protein